MIEELKRNGQTAEVAEQRLNDMLQFIAWRAEAINKVARSPIFLDVRRVRNSNAGAGLMQALFIGQTYITSPS